MPGLRRLGDLSLAASAGGGHLAAASGLVALGERLYVASDDEVDLFLFAPDGTGGRRLPLFPGALDEQDHELRKAHKPDIEALARVGDRLLALGSGSSPARRRGALVALGPDGILPGSPEILDLSALYDELAGEVGAVNVEGAAVVGEEIVLAQRGNGTGSADALVRVTVGDLLAGRGPLRAVAEQHLGELDGVPLTMTDLAPAGDARLLFAAAAEATDDPYLDGPVAGSAIGVLSADGAVEALDLFPGPVKLEGLSRAPGREGVLLAVSDPDDRTSPSGLFELDVPADR